MYVIRHILLLLGAFVLFLNGTCEDECPHELGPFGYVFHAEVTLSPLQETYRVGDTINVAFRMPGEILNEGTSTFVKLSHVDIRTLSSISRIDLPITIPELRGDVFHNFQLITYPQSVGQVRLVRINDFSSDAESVPLRNTHGDYVFNYSLVAKTAGLYSFGFGSINFGEELGFQENIVEIEGECNTTKQLYTILQNPLPGNLDLRCESNVIDYCISDEPRRTEAYETYRKRANHVFRVVE